MAWYHSGGCDCPIGCCDCGSYSRSYTHVITYYDPAYKRENKKYVKSHEKPVEQLHYVWNVYLKGNKKNLPRLRKLTDKEKAELNAN